MIEPYFLLYFIAWLHLLCSVSHVKCQTAVTYLLYIVKKCHQLPLNVEFQTRAPVDICTITKHLQCYLLYDIETAPPECGFQQTENSCVVKTLFWTLTIYPLDTIHKASKQCIQRPSVPRPHHTNQTSLFVMQDFNDWLEWKFFLSCLLLIITNQMHARSFIFKHKATCYFQPPVTFIWPLLYLLIALTCLNVPPSL
ncbi:hypothetical protein VP01_11g3 [Puccinia sorghi]|uniref:Uncharacterized protein n=1 Tax=Puccinia sorghi TaxID=27349 RepID=A0A0L6VS16_9BASI|nr:hypothetical protein VP01_11g3 [Puccinia sorghi]